VKKIQNYLEYAIILLIRSVIDRLPWKWAQAFGKGLGYFCYYVVPIRKQVAVQNIRLVFPNKTDQEVLAIARGAYLQFAQTLIEFIQLPRRSAAFLRKQVRFIPPNFLDRAQRAPYGAICLSGHFGNWELMGAAITDCGIPLCGVAKEQRNPFVDQLIAKSRAKRNIQTYALGISVRGILKSLQEKKFVAILGDQDAHREGVFINFLGQPSATAKGPASLALKTGAPLIFGAAVRETDGTHSIYLEEIPHSDLNGMTDENISTLTQRHAAVLEKYIRQYPDHWFWMHRRWKTKPHAPPV